MEVSGLMDSRGSFLAQKTAWGATERDSASRIVLNRYPRPEARCPLWVDFVAEVCCKLFWSVIPSL
jgi:hypothetical protein